VNDPATPALRAIRLPAVLQFAGRAPCFGTLASLSEQGLAFDFHESTPPEHAIGARARLDFDFQGAHHSCNGLLVHLQGSRGLLSLRDAPASLLSALHSASRESTPRLAAQVSRLQAQHACHARFMAAMKTVVDGFFRHLGDAARDEAPPSSRRVAQLKLQLTPLRPAFLRQFTETYPMYPEMRASYSESNKAKGDLQLVDLERVDDWIRRSGIAHQVDESLNPLPEVFSLHYAELTQRHDKQAQHPYSADSVLDVLADLIAPLGLDAEARARCYEAMAEAFREQGARLYESMLALLGETQSQLPAAAEAVPDLAEWLRQALQEPPATAERGAGGEATTAGSAVPQLGALAELVARLTADLGDLAAQQRRLPSAQEFAEVASLIPGLLARERILGRFLPAGDLPALAAPGGSLPLGGLGALDGAALDSLYAQLMQPPPVEPGPEKLAAASQVRALMLQAQGLLLEYTLNGLTYQAQPDHPAWRLMNALDALHLGADDHGQFLDPALHQAISLAMQWLLGQHDSDAALAQVNALLDKIVGLIRADQRARRRQHLQSLGEADAVPAPISSGWCVVKLDDEAIPYEVLGRFGDHWTLLNRSATRLLDVPLARFVDDLDRGRIEEAGSFDEPFLDRIANATLTASLEAVHTFTWQDPGSGCLKRTALMDELERRLAHPVSNPPSFCALIEIPTMRPAMSSLPGDDLAVMQKRTGEMLREMLHNGEQCGRLSDVSFLLVFAPQDPAQLAERLTQLKLDVESLHPEWKLIGAAVPLVADPGQASPSNVLRRANEACAPLRQHAGFDLSCLAAAAPASVPVDTLPLEALFLRCQKIAPCSEGALAHYEVLLGVDEAGAPGHTTQSFVVMAEQSGRIHDLDAWVLESALRWMQDNSAGMHGLSGLSVNVSGQSLLHAEHVERMLALFGAYPQLTSKLILEVTETAAIDNLEQAARALRKFRQHGCRVALDDFGSGYSSYGYLRQLPLDYLKIDGTYIRNVLNDRTDQALTASMVEVAHALGLKVIAEYVDSEATSAWLKGIGVDYLQGYWVHKPQRLDELTLLTLH
jgi:EAL domain-containing protein (putative c-di-GMP-specific phosphodiesterase class I)